VEFSQKERKKNSTPLNKKVKNIVLEGKINKKEMLNATARYSTKFYGLLICYFPMPYATTYVLIYFIKNW